MLLIGLIGAPCSGKGTFARALQAVMPVTHVSTGELLRAQAERDANLAERLARGELASESEVRALIHQAAADAAAGGQTLLLDGAPRRAEQLDQLRGTPQGQRGALMLLVLSAPDEVLRARAAGRAKTESRPEDAPEVFERRLEIFREAQAGVIAAAEQAGVVTVRLDGTAAPQELAAAVKALIRPENTLWAHQK